MYHDKNELTRFKNSLRVALRKHYTDMRHVNKSEFIIIPINGMWSGFEIQHQHGMVRLHYNFFPLCIPLNHIDFFIPANLGGFVPLVSGNPDQEYIGSWFSPDFDRIPNTIEVIINSFDSHRHLIDRNKHIDAFYEYVIHFQKKGREINSILGHLSCLLNDNKYTHYIDEDIAWYERNYSDKINSTRQEDRGFALPYQNLKIVRSLLTDRPKLIEQMTKWAFETICRYKLEAHFNRDCFNKFI